jgi:hypothetical protein
VKGLTLVSWSGLAVLGVDKIAQEQVVIRVSPTSLVSDPYVFVICLYYTRCHHGVTCHVVRQEASTCLNFPAPRIMSQINLFFVK